MKTVELEEILYGYVESAGDVEKGPYKQYALYTNTQKGKLIFKFWNIGKKENFPKAGDYIKVKVLDISKATDELNTYKSLSLDSSSRSKPNFCDYIPINQEDVPSDIIGIIFKDRSRQMSFAANLLKDSSYWSNKNNHKFLMELLKPKLDKFTTVPAAVEHHHNYKGGLFVHTSEVFSNCYAIINAACNKEFYSDLVEPDVLYMSAWLHDLGKIEVYYMEGDCPKINSDKENQIGHPTISNNFFIEFASKKLDQNFIDKVSHCILSHHERPEWGAVIKPQTLEAIILCRADFISSRISN